MSRIIAINDQEIKGGDSVIIKRTEVRSVVKEISKASNPVLYRVPVNPTDPSGYRYTWFRREELQKVPSR